MALRAELLPEPARSASLDLLRRYTSASVQFSEVQPGSQEFRTIDDELALLILFASCAALMALGIHLAVVGRGLISSVAAALVVVGVLFVSYDLDRPTRGLITVPDAPRVALRDQLQAMD